VRIVSRIAALVLWAAVVALAVLGVQAPWSPSGWVALTALAVVGLALFLGEPRPRRVLGTVGLFLVLVLLVVRGVGTGSGLITMRTLPSGDAARWLGRLVDEQDLALAGARVLGLRWRFSPDERQGLLPAMGDTYAAMRRDDAYSPSPVLDTLLGRQGPNAFDTLTIEPRADSKRGVPTKFGVIFLHGFAGSFTVECWLVASAAREIGAVTVCPATDFSGHWRGDQGEKILRATLDDLHARGIKRVFLAGLSNGAVGASELAPRFASSLEGLILISGAPTAGAAGLPTLVIQGAHDAVAPASVARAFADRTHGTYAEFDGGHFVLLVRRAETRAALVNWLMRQAGYRRSEGNLR
jgi:pimeloyl-ACP methyl ester carboxylesterase